MIKWIIILIILFASVFINGTPFIFGDGYGYYHTAKTISDEGRFVTQTKPEYFPYTGHAVNLDDRGNYSTDYPFGNTIFWLPALTISKVINTQDTYYTAFNGHSLNDGLAILITSTIVLFFTLVLTFKILRKLGFSSRNSFLSLTLVYISMYAFSYLYYYSSYAHINELFSFTLLIYLFLKTAEVGSSRNFILFGFTISLLTVTRPVDIVAVIPFAIYLIYKHKFKAVRNIVIGGIPLGVLFLYYNYVSFGSPFAMGHNAAQLSLSNFNIVHFLFSDIRGLFIWSPLLILGMIKLIHLGFTDKQLIYRLVLVSFLLLLGIYNFWPNWWGGDSLGQRFVIIAAPIFALVLAKLFSDWRPKKIVFWFTITISILLTSFSALVQILYRVTPVMEINYEGVQVGEFLIPKEERFTPFDIIQYHSRALNENTSLTEYGKFLMNSFNGGRSLLLLTIGQTDPLVIAIAEGDDLNIKLIPNTKGSLPSFITIWFSYKGSTYLLNQHEFRTQEIKINCAESCKSDQASIQEFDKMELVPVNEDFGIGIQSTSRVNLINRKLKI